MRKIALALIFSAICFCVPICAESLAQDQQQPTTTQTGTPDTAAQRREKEFQAALEAAQRVIKSGPPRIALIDQGHINLPDGYLFVPKAEAARLMRAMGNNTGSNFLGILLNAKDGLRWFATLQHNKAGFVKDDDAKNWNADQLLSQLREGTEAGNKDRVARGFPPIEIVGWIAPPTYEPTTRRLIWSALLRGKGAPLGTVGSANYNTYALGREGYYQLNLVADANEIDGFKQHAAVLLEALEYAPGKRYADFKPSVDSVAGYGITALVAGVAAKKLGLFALIAAFAIKMWKLLALGVVAVVWFFRRMFSRSEA